MATSNAQPISPRGGTSCTKQLGWDELLGKYRNRSYLLEAIQRGVEGLPICEVSTRKVPDNINASCGFNILSNRVVVLANTKSEAEAMIQKRGNKRVCFAYEICQHAATVHYWRRWSHNEIVG